MPRTTYFKTILHYYWTVYWSVRFLLDVEYTWDGTSYSTNDLASSEPRDRTVFGLLADLILSWMMPALLILARSSLSPRSLSLSSEIRFNHFELLNNFPYNHIHFDFKLFDVFVGNPRLTFSTTKSTTGFQRRLGTLNQTHWNGRWLVHVSWLWQADVLYSPREYFAHMHMETSTLSVKGCKS